MVLWNQYISCHEKEGLTLSWYFHAKIVSLASFSARRWPAPDHTTTSCKTTRRPTSFSRTISMCVIASKNVIFIMMCTACGGKGEGGGPNQAQHITQEALHYIDCIPVQKKISIPQPFQPIHPYCVQNPAPGKSMDRRNSTLLTRSDFLCHTIF